MSDSPVLATFKGSEMHYENPATMVVPIGRWTAEIRVPADHPIVKTLGLTSLERPTPMVVVVRHGWWRRQARRSALRAWRRLNDPQTTLTIEQLGD